MCKVDAIQKKSFKFFQTLNQLSIMDNLSRYINYWIRIIIVFSLITRSNSLHAQEKVKATTAFVQEDNLVIKVNIPSSKASCFSIQRVELLDLETKSTIVAKSLEGSFKYLPTGNHELNLEACPLPPQKVERVIPVKKDLILETKHSRVGLILLAGSTSIITAIVANSIKSTFNSKVAVLTELDTNLPQIDGQFTSQADLEKWNAAHTEAQNARKTGLLNTMVGCSVLSLAYEVYLLTSKPKKVTHAIEIHPSSGYNYNTGLALTYKF